MVFNFTVRCDSIHPPRIRVDDLRLVLDIDYAYIGDSRYIRYAFWKTDASFTKRLGEMFSGSLDQSSPSYDCFFTWLRTSRKRGNSQHANERGVADVLGGQAFRESFKDAFGVDPKRFTLHGYRFRKHSSPILSGGVAAW